MKRALKLLFLPGGLGVALAWTLTSGAALAQGALPALPPGPSASASAAPALPPPAAPPASSPSASGAPASAPVESAPSPPPASAPPPFVYEPAPLPVHAPHTAFWLGAQVGAIGYGGAFFLNQRNKEETSGNFVGAGGALELDVGARLNRRYIPYVLVEYAALAPGHRFDRDTQAASSLLGVGFRFVLGNVDRAGFLADLSLAQRTIAVRRGGQEFQMRGPELFRLSLGAEVRLTNLVTLSPIMHLSGGSMAQSDGSVTYVSGQGDGETQPSFQDTNISGSQRSYLVVGIGCGVHFDLFGR
ncbi:MAG: hypothetical protein U0235_15665 [Polyangiaceae bacterium]